MDEDNYYAEENDERDEQEEYMNFNKSKKNKISIVFLYQSIICLALLAALGGMKFMVPDKFEQFKGQLALALEGDEFKRGIQNVCQNIIDSINKLTPLNSNSQSSQESSVSSQDQSSTTEESSNVEQNKPQISPSAQQITYKPYVIPVSGHITSPFGARENPINGHEGEIHEGVDIGAVEGTEIKAIANGKVTLATSSARSGNYLIIDHGNGITSLYAHCSQILVGEGDDINQGQIIAKVGHTGEATGPHLHLGIRQNGEFINPTQILPELG